MPSLTVVPHTPVAAKRPLAIVTEKGEAQVVIRHLRFCVDRAVADNEVLRERAVKEGLTKGAAQLEAEGWRFLRVVLDTDPLPPSIRRKFPVPGNTGTPLVEILPHVDLGDAAFVDPGIPEVPPPPRGSGVTEDQIAGYARECARIEAAQRAYQARDFTNPDDRVDVRVYAKFVAPPDVIVRALASSLLGSKR